MKDLTLIADNDKRVSRADHSVQVAGGARIAPGPVGQPPGGLVNIIPPPPTTIAKPSSPSQPASSALAVSGAVVIATIVLGLVAGGIASVLFVTAQLTANPKLVTDAGFQEIVSYARRSIPFAAAIGFVVGLTSDAVLGKLLGLDVVRPAGITAERRSYRNLNRYTEVSEKQFKHFPRGA